VALAAFLVAAGIHNALLIEPMSVLGPARHQGEMAGYLARVFWMHVLITVPLSLAGIVTSFFFFRTALGPALLVMSVCFPFLLFFWMTRRAHYLESEARHAATSSLIYCLSLVAFIGIAWRTGHLTVAASFVSMAAASVFAGLISFRKLRVVLRLEPDGFLRALRDHWTFGKWLLPATFLSPLVFQIQTFATGALLGLSAAGVLRALLNPIMPAIQVVTALAFLAIPVLSRSFGDGRTGDTYRRGVLYTLAMVGIAAVYELTIVATGGGWDVLLYKGRYSEWDALMPVLGLVPVASAVAAGCAVILRAVQRPALMTTANLIGGLFGVASVYPLIRTWHLAGAVYGLLASQVVTAVACVGLVAFSRVRPTIKYEALAGC
jgi:O-antigen/teichoic acid export membrane protein